MNIVCALVVILSLASTVNAVEKGRKGSGRISQMNKNQRDLKSGKGSSKSGKGGKGKGSGSPAPPSPPSPPFPSPPSPSPPFPSPPSPSPPSPSPPSRTAPSRLFSCDGDVVDYVRKKDEFSIFFDLLKAAGLTDNLKEDRGPFTVFAPDNHAFRDAYNDRQLRDLQLRRNRRETRQLMRYHYVTGDRILKRGFKDGRLRADNGKFIHVDVQNSGRRVVLNGRVHIDDFDNRACNGVVHQVGDVLIPP